MLENQSIKRIFTLTSAALLLLATVLSATGCGEVKEMMEILEGGDDSRIILPNSGDNSEESEEASVEPPDTAAELFVTAPKGEGLAITGYTGTDSFVKIPEVIDGKSVLAVNAGAIKDVKNENGGGVTVTEIVVPSSVTQIGFSAFSECKKLESLTLPFVGGDTANYKYIGYLFGAYSTAANGKVLPESLTSIRVNGGDIGDEAFLGCEFIVDISLSGTSVIGKKAFSGCSVLDTLSIPDSVTEIGEGAFNGCQSLRVISLPYLGNGSDKLFFGAVFGAESYDRNSECVPASLRNVTVTCPEDIPAGAFYECNGISSLTLRSNVKTVGENAFYRCKKLRSITVESTDFDGIKTLAPYAFAYCASLGEIELDGDITLLPEGVFYGCSALRTVRFGDSENIMPSAVTELGKGAFGYCENLLSMELSSALTVIEEQAFYGCSYLRSLTVPDNVTEIKKDAFKGCGTLKTLTVGSKLTTIGDGAFSYCTSLNGVTLPSNVSVFGDYAFAYCSYITELTIQCNNADIGKGVFSGCPSIVITVKQDSATYTALIEEGLGNSNLKAPE